MDIGQAMNALKSGRKVYREGWNGKGMYIFLHVPDTAKEPSTLPYIVMFTAQGDRVPWLASQTDILAYDWQAVE